jgi:hypothetical protein
VIGLGLGPALIALYLWGFDHLALVHWPEGSLVPWLLAWVLADFGHYWHHRLDHRVAACWAVHGVHHQPEEMNFTVAMRHAWFSDLYSFPFYSPLVLLGVPVSQFFAATTLLSFHALITHTEHFQFPSLGLFVTPRSHVLHHARNAPYLDRNFGAMFCIWDKLFGTHVALDPGTPPVYGTDRGYETHDGVLSQWVLVRDVLTLVRHAPTWRERLRVLTSRPGWAPPGLELARAESPRPSATLPRSLKLYAVLQFGLTLALSLFVFIPRDSYSPRFLLVSAAAILASLFTLGGLLDGRPHAWRLELARLGATALGAAAWAAC